MEAGAGRDQPPPLEKNRALISNTGFTPTTSKKNSRGGYSGGSVYKGEWILNRVTADRQALAGPTSRPCWTGIAHRLCAKRSETSASRGKPPICATEVRRLEAVIYAIADDPMAQAFPRSTPAVEASSTKRWPLYRGTRWHAQVARRAHGGAELESLAR